MGRRSTAFLALAVASLAEVACSAAKSGSAGASGGAAMSGSAGASGGAAMSGSAAASGGTSGGSSGSTSGGTSGSTSGGSSGTSRPPSPQKPGPSADLFASPFYACLRNFYVSTGGSDTADGSQAHPWQTLQHANDSGPMAGDCINVMPGTYAAGVTISHGGNLAAATGYVVYRCTQLDACVVTDPASAFAFETSTFPMPNYVVIDGFDMAAASAQVYGQGVKVWDGNEAGAKAANSSHHVWVLDNLIHGYGQTGVQMNDGEFFFTIHNTIHDNAHVTCDAQGSGVSYVVLKAFAGYKPTADDTTNPSPLIGSLTTGSTFFHNAVEWNAVYDNALTQCGSATNAYDTDGNDIILDTLNNAGSTGVA
jgi:hypothetical protein